MTIYTELSRIQKLLKAPKSQRNSFGWLLTTLRTLMRKFQNQQKRTS